MRFFAFLVYGIIAVTFAIISCINYALLYCGIASILEILEYNTYNKPIKLLLLLPGVNSPWYRIKLRPLFKHQLSVYHYLESGIRRSNLHTMDIASSTRLANMLSLRTPSKSKSPPFIFVI